MRWSIVGCTLAAACRIDFDPLIDGTVFRDAAVSPEAVFGVHGDTGSQLGTAVAVGTDGSIALAGAFQNSLPMGTTPTSAGGYDGFVASLRADGRLRWVRAFGGTADDFARAVAIDLAGNIVVTGDFGGTADFGTGPLTALGEADIFVASYAPDGTPRWSRRYGDTVTGSTYGSELGNAIAVGSNQIYVAGQFAGTVDFGTGPLTMSATGDDIVLFALDPQGTTAWAHHYGSNQINKVAGITADATGVAFTGYFQGTADLGGAPLANNGGNEIFVAAYDPGGNHLWSRSFGGNGLDFGRGIARDAAGNAYVTGYYETTVDFGAGPSTTASIDAFVLSLSPTGAYNWSHTFGATCAKGQDVAVAGDRVYVVGEFDTPIAAPMLTSTGPGDAFVIAYDLAGNVTSMQAYGGASYDSAQGVAVLPAGAVVVAGKTGVGDDCATTTGIVGEEDMFVVRFPMQ